MSGLQVLLHTSFHIPLVVSAAESALGKGVLISAECKDLLNLGFDRGGPEKIASRYPEGEEEACVQPLCT